MTTYTRQILLASLCVVTVLSVATAGAVIKQMFRERSAAAERLAAVKARAEASEADLTSVRGELRRATDERVQMQDELRKLSLRAEEAKASSRRLDADAAAAQEADKFGKFVAAMADEETEFRAGVSATGRTILSELVNARLALTDESSKKYLAALAEHQKQHAADAERRLAAGQRKTLAYLSTLAASSAARKRAEGVVNDAVEELRAQLARPLYNPQATYDELTTSWKKRHAEISEKARLWLVERATTANSTERAQTIAAGTALQQLFLKHVTVGLDRAGAERIMTGLTADVRREMALIARGAGGDWSPMIDGKQYDATLGDVYKKFLQVISAND